MFTDSFATYRVGGVGFITIKEDMLTLPMYGERKRRVASTAAGSCKLQLRVGFIFKKPAREYFGEAVWDRVSAGESGEAGLDEGVRVS